MTSSVQSHSAPEERPIVHRLPEHLRAMDGVLLFATDCIAALLALIVTAVISHSGAAPFLALAATLLVATANGRYRTNYAVTANDQWYHAVGTAILGAICGVTLAALLGFEWIAALAAAALWLPIAGMSAVRLHRMRREADYEGITDYVRDTRRGPAWHAQQATIRVLDVIFATCGAIVLAPVLAAIAIVVLHDSGLPVLFSQERVGRNDGAFTMWKFRTMRHDAGAQWARPGDARITRAGAFLRRTSLDELPQLLNVIRGEMSLVGPRPEMREYADLFTRQMYTYSQRHILRPGLTGWAQLYFDRNFQPEDEPEVLRCDLFYIQNASVSLYMFCLVKTACELFSHRAV